MAIRKRPVGYTGTQIFLHWAIAALVIVQLVLGEDIKPAYRTFLRDIEPATADLFNANVHVYLGIAVLLLGIWRLAVRLVQGAPEAPASESAGLRRLAATTHFVLYLMIFGMPLTGILAWYFSLEAMGEIHEIAKPAIIVVVSLHAAAALWQHFYMKSDVLVRILKPRA